MIFTKAIIRRSILAGYCLFMSSSLFCRGDDNNNNNKGKEAPMTRSYDCDHPENAQCGAGQDRYYELIAVYDKYRVDNYPGLSRDKDYAYMRVRSFVGGAGFANDDEKMLDNALGPTMKVSPGQTVSILLRNTVPANTPPSPIGDGHNEDSVIKMKYFPQLNKNNTEGAYYSMQENGFTFYGDTPQTIEDVEVPNPENIPYDYNGVNIHLHGIIVNPHLFYPQGTDQVSAPYINVGPGQCYCYNFYIPEEHPTGTYWWHTHRHGSSAIWTWGQAAGLIEIEGGAFEQDLKKQGVDIEEAIPFVVTDPHLIYARGELNTYVVTPFLGGQNGVKMQHEVLYLVNGQGNPTFEMRPGETRWLKYLTATTENLVSFKIVNKETDEVLGTWDLASDGVNYASPVYTEEFLHGGGMRQDLLLQFPEAGIYEVITEGNGKIQFFGKGPPDELLATFNITGDPITSPIDIESMEFTVPPIHAHGIKEEDITVRRTVSFDVNGDVRIVPFPQMVINQEAFHIDEIMYDLVMDGHAEEWTLMSTANATHPFHIHVVPFLVKSSYTANGSDRYELYTDAYSTTDTWRDVIVVPPYGVVKIWLKFSPVQSVNLNGKSVFHCHFLAHEDTGMIAQIMFVDPTLDTATTNDWDVACAVEELSSMCTLLETCGGYHVTGSYTIFAPTNEAIAELDEAVVGGLNNLDKETLCGIFQFHTIEGIIHSDDLDCETAGGAATLLEMSNGKYSRFKCDTDGNPYGIKGGGNAEPANFVEADIDTPNGVIHIIDQVLLYPSAIHTVGDVTYAVQSLRGDLDMP